MGVVFHFYNSDDEGWESGEEDGRGTRNTKQTKKQVPLG